MAKVSFRKAVNYPPWIGGNYGARGATRLLIIGRSYYDARYRDRSIEGYINDLIRGRAEDNFYTALELVLADAKYWKSGLGGKLKLDRKKFWNSVSYHQFLQGILNDGYTPPSKEMWKQGQDVYKEILIALQPDIIVMAGSDVFNNMPTLGGKKGRTYEWRGTRMNTWILDLGGMECRIAEMETPRSSSFNTGVWKELYQQFMADYKSAHKLGSFSSS